ncbi:Nonaspanin TM9SF [Cytidiella melzeri]|nr:Nonaspanin TM9SF [Cytidiella melzeri]
MIPKHGCYLASALVASLLSCADAFYLPGAAPHDYRAGEQVQLFVNALTPMLAAHDNAKIKSMLNYDYYNPGFHFCEPEGGPKSQGESLGSILFGDRIFNSAYNIVMLQDNTTCRTLCTSEVPAEDAKFINERIREDYAINWLLDGLPAAELKRDNRTGDIFFDMGFNLGDDEGEYAEMPALNNHYDIVLEYHSPQPGLYRIVGVLVWPSSHGGDQTTAPDCSSSSQNVKLVLNEETSNVVRYSYQVTWRESATPWATRWDNYLHIFDPQIHWFSLVNSVVVVLCLVFMVSMILLRAVSRDISRYNAIDLSEDVQEDWGWKLVHGEVFRIPPNSLILSVLIGNGAQLCAMVGVTLVFALLGFLSPSNRGSLATVMMICWTFFGSISGYFSSRSYASMGGTEKRKQAFFAAVLLPTIVFAVIFLLNMLLLTAGSSGAVPFGTMATIVLLWFGISAPLSAVGSYYGSKHGALQNPVRVNPIPRQIPPVPWYLRTWASALFAGILPFGAAFVELYFVMSSLFASRAYYAFGFLALTAGVVGLTTATVSILFTYFLLCAEEYRWHWRAFLTGGGSAFWVLAYGLFYWANRLSLGSFQSKCLYLGYLMLLALFDFLVTGTIGFLATYWAVRRLYTSIRVD